MVFIGFITSLIVIHRGVGTKIKLGGVGGWGADLILTCVISSK